ncbi:MAG: hypothetical protein WBV76_07175, partial [Pseudolabrys sp.]
PAHRGVNLSVAISRLLMDKEPLRHDQIQVIFCPGHCHIEKPSALRGSRLNNVMLATHAWAGP